MGEDKCITAGNASQLSDGASACVVMDGTLASQRGIEPLGIYRGMVVAGCEPDEMGVGPVFAVPKLLERHGLTMDDIDLWELNEAFAAQVLPCADEVGIDHDKLNVNGGAIALGHPFGMTGARIMTTLLNGLEDSDKEFGVESMCVGGGQGMAMVVQRLS